MRTVRPKPTTLKGCGIRTASDLGVCDEQWLGGVLGKKGAELRPAPLALMIAS